jgi:hyperosmotically inducible protein
MKASTVGLVALAGALTFGAAVAGAANKGNPGPRTDADITKSVLHEIRMYPYYSLWDDVEFQVSNGHVELNGAVTQPVKKSDIEHIVQKVPGVQGVTDNIEVLPLSPNDNLLRRQIAAAIYRDPTLSRYAWGPVPAIHIIVDNGRITLAGVVDNDGDKNLAGLRAASAGLSFGPIVNNLQVEHSSPSKS